MKRRRSVLCLAAPAMIGSLLLAAAPSLPPTPAAALDLLYASYFAVEQPFVFTWSAERPSVSEGTIVVLRVEADLIRPRQTAEPVLYVGPHAAWRISPYNEGGLVVAFVPGRVDLARAAVWYGTPELPERVSASTTALEAQRAREAGIRPFGSTVVESAFARGGPGVEFHGRTDLLRALHTLALDYGASADRR